MRSIKEDYVKVKHIHLKPVRAGLVKRAEDWGQSSARDYTVGRSTTGSANGILAIDRVLLSAGEGVRI